MGTLGIVSVGGKATRGEVGDTHAFDVDVDGGDLGEHEVDVHRGNHGPTTQNLACEWSAFSKNQVPEEEKKRGCGLENLSGRLTGTETRVHARKRVGRAAEKIFGGSHIEDHVRHFSVLVKA